MTGTPSQIEWAERIKPLVAAEFERVAAAFRRVADDQREQDRPEQDRSDTQAVLHILEEKRAEVMAREQAGYFIRDWQELKDQVQQMIAGDKRYQAIRTRSGKAGKIA
jgi:hypothetical protein